MCGIAGGVNADETSVSEMLDRIRHRGPDGRGISTCGACVHGHVRLAMLDLTPASDQPFSRGRSLLSFVGEIWNYREIRSTLQAEGASFSTTGDTEVLAAALERWGVRRAFRKLDGMFTFVWSTPTRHLLVRDRHGKVPVYYARRGAAMLYASERKSFREVEPVALAPGFALDLESGRTFDLRSRVHAISPTPSLVMAWLRDAVARRLHADAPVCCLISGGLDSSLILAMVAERTRDLAAYTAFIDETGNEDLKAARRLCAEMGISHVACRITGGVELFRDALRAIEIDSKAQIEIAALCLPLARRIRSDGFKACLSAESADELFGGYGNFCIRASKTDDRGTAALRAAQLVKMSRGNFVRCNKAFMAAGVECRLPFMQPELVSSCVGATKAENPPGKKLLKTAARELVPKWVISRQKETFQGAGGTSRLAERSFADAPRWYRCELRTTFGYVPHD